MDRLPGKYFFAALVTLFACLPASARAEGEITGVFGGLAGGDFNALMEGDFVTSFENAPLYGVRLGWFGYPLALEGSLVGSPSGVAGDFFDGQAGLDTRVIYAEANLLLIPIPGPVSPFATAGMGLHSFDFDVAVDVAGNLKTDVRKLGFNWGGGVKANIQRLSLRFDIRDHVTTLGLDDFGLGLIGDLLQLDVGETIHNVEVSFGVGLRF